MRQDNPRIDLSKWSSASAVLRLYHTLTRMLNTTSQVAGNSSVKSYSVPDFYTGNTVPGSVRDLLRPG